jgi:transcriptional regulator with XRE-family HTH domain
MNWEEIAGELVRASRRESGLTQAALAQASRVPQPTISEIESGKRQPSLSLLGRIVEAAQGPVQLNLVRLERHSAAATAQRVEEALSRAMSGEDSAHRAVIDLRNALLVADGERLVALSKETPRLCGDRRFDAFIAGVVEEAFARRRISPPAWTQEALRFVRPFWYVSGLDDLRWWEFSTAPGPLMRHGVLAAKAELESV